MPRNALSCECSYARRRGFSNSGRKIRTQPYSARKPTSIKDSPWPAPFVGGSRRPPPVWRLAFGLSLEFSFQASNSTCIWLCLFCFSWKCFWKKSHHGKLSQLHTGPIHAQSEPIHAQSGPIHSQTGPIHSLSRPIHLQSAPIHSQSGPIHLRSAPIHSQSALTHSQSAPHPFAICTDSCAICIDPFAICTGSFAICTDPFAIWADPFAI